MSDAAIALVSVGLGWALAESTALVRSLWVDRRRRKRLRAGLVEELRDLEPQLERVAHFFLRQIQISALQGVERTVCTPVQNMFFKQYFRDAFQDLNRHQRLSFQMIHSTLDTLNDGMGRHDALLQDIYDSSSLTPDGIARCKAWGSGVEADYQTVMTIRWYIWYHLQHPKAPAQEIMGPFHERYLRFQVEVEEHVESVKNRAKALKREDFEKVYDKDWFEDYRHDSE